PRTVFFFSSSSQLRQEVQPQTPAGDALQSTHRYTHTHTHTQTHTGTHTQVHTHTQAWASPQYNLGGTRPLHFKKKVVWTPPTFAIKILVHDWSTNPAFFLFIASQSNPFHFISRGNTHSKRNPDQ